MKITFYVNQENASPYRTHNIANARNYCLNYIKQNKELYPYFVMMDCDDVNCKVCEPEIIRKYWKREDWDAVFQYNPKVLWYLGIVNLSLLF